MKIEEGKYYRTAAGEKVGPMEWVDDEDTYVWMCVDPAGRYLTWAADGRYSVTGREPHRNLVAEWVDEPAPQQEQSTRDDMPAERPDWMEVPNKDYAAAIRAALDDADGIYRAFAWSRTSEGGEYWHGVARNGHTNESRAKLRNMLAAAERVYKADHAPQQERPASEPDYERLADVWQAYLHGRDIYPKDVKAMLKIAEIMEDGNGNL